MNKFFFIIGLFLSCSVFSQIDKVLPNPQRPERLYNDFTGGKNFITPEQADFLERKLVAYNDSTSSQVAIVIVEDLEGYDANEYATALGRKWGIGGKQFSNGIVILISTGGSAGNRAAYIAVGYGLEGAIPDILAKRILENELIPNFRNGNFYQGLNETVDAIIKAAAGEYTAPKGYGKKGLKLWKIILIVFGVWILIGIIAGGRRGGGGYASRRGYRGGLGPTWMGGGMGGSHWGSSGGGGGFGGFGGGSFGGGGAGGRW